MANQVSRSFALSTVPNKKLSDALEQTLRDCQSCSANSAKLDNCCSTCRVINTALQRYAESNIPAKYWKLEMDKHFKGDSVLMEKYRSVVNNIRKSYTDGICLCFAGKNGVGKTLVCTNILKRAVEKGYSGLYTTLSDVVATITSRESDDKYTARKELLTVDFLVIDEFDPRYMGSDSAADLYGVTLENIFRSRAQNCLPLFMCTNSPNVTESFTGPVKQSISSLMNYATTVSVLGKDYRKEETK